MKSPSKESMMVSSTDFEFLHLDLPPTHETLIFLPQLFPPFLFSNRGVGTPTYMPPMSLSV
ncbi:hypothetical protein Mapa_001243 [Marchantia paleacea]|nr:hypothetical protein Mapa_001243 [Marchantia paleacea]